MRAKRSSLAVLTASNRRRDYRCIIKISLRRCIEKRNFQWTNFKGLNDIQEGAMEEQQGSNGNQCQSSAGVLAEQWQCSRPECQSTLGTVEE